MQTGRTERVLKRADNLLINGCEGTGGTTDVADGSLGGKDWGRVSLGGKNRSLVWFMFGMPVRHPSGGTEKSVGHLSRIEFRGKV